MFNQLFTDLRAAPDRLTARARGLRQRASARASAVQGQGRERLWNAQHDALTRTAALLDSELVDKAEQLPGLGKVTDAATRLVQRRLEQLNALPIGDYETINAKDAIAAIKGIDDRVALRLLDKHESANKKRKTVLAAIAAQLGS